jgi:hypothetical protein
MGRSARTRRLCCSIASAQPARRREKAGKLQPPAIQSWVSEQLGTDSPYERGQVGEQVTRLEYQYAESFGRAGQVT